MFQLTNLDSTTSLYFLRDLEHIKQKTYDIMKAPLRAFTLIPVESSVDSGAESITYRQYDQTGIAQIIANYADDLPRADVQGKEFTSTIKSIGDSYGYSLQDIRAAAHSGRPLQQRKANAALRAQQEKWEQIAWYGDAEYNLPGFLTNPNIPSSTAGATGTGSSTNWADKTPQQIIDELNGLVNRVVTRTKGAEKPNTLLLPIEQYTLISSQVYSTNTENTILTVFLKNSPHITSVEWCDALSAAELAANEVSDFTGDIAIVYDRNPDKLTFEFPQPFEQLQVQERGLEFIVPCHSRVGGTIIYYPLSMEILEGI